ncbi:hypothetical protein TRICHSKD4_4028 [Roseibium sp. TrichSKD4]|nr:hypothetical protein TRICHSKD4_4028 [Roseibium sp. TrichSKD4]
MYGREKTGRLKGMPMGHVGNDRSASAVSRARLLRMDQNL